MSGYDNILNLLILYDTARGFLPLTETADVVHHALLSFTGAAGTRRADWFAHDGAGRFTLVPDRGARPVAPPSFHVPPFLVERLAADPGPLALNELGADAGALADTAGHLGHALLVPVVDDGTLHGLVGIGDKLLGEFHTDTERSLVHEIALLLGAALTRQKGTAPGAARSDTNETLANLKKAHPPLVHIAGESPATRALIDEILTLADFDLPVLVMGETGTGKELVARALHDLGPRADGPFEAINCAAIPRELVSSHLFGHEKGAFTGAVGDSRGAFERAGEGTLFLDEIGDMPLDVQASLLRVLQERRFTRVGGEKPLPARARILSATNRNLEEAVAAGTFRADLFYRIQMYSLRILPLRDRREDIPGIVDHILDDVRHVRGTAPKATPAFLAALMARPLMGNVRELEGLVLSSIVRTGGGPLLEASHLAPAPRSAPATAPGGAPLPGGAPMPGTAAPSDPAAAAGEASPTATAVLPYEEMEREYIRSVLKVTEGNKKQAAALMGIPRSTLNDRMKKLGLDPNG
jgi:DNA-binding NtrC family response regulator